MNKPLLIDNIKLLITQGKTKRAIDELIQLTQSVATDLNDSALLLRNRIATLEREIIEGVISHADQKIEEARITKALLTLTSSIEEALFLTKEKQDKEAEAKRQKDERQKAEAKRQEDERQKAEAKRQEDERQKAEAKRQEDERQKAEAKRREEERLKQETHWNEITRLREEEQLKEEAYQREIERRKEEVQLKKEAKRLENSANPQGKSYGVWIAVVGLAIFGLAVFTFYPKEKETPSIVVEPLKMVKFSGEVQFSDKKAVPFAVVEWAFQQKNYSSKADANGKYSIELPNDWVGQSINVTIKQGGKAVISQNVRAEAEILKVLKIPSR